MHQRITGPASAAKWPGREEGEFDGDDADRRVREEHAA
jgi:hypothetical protein